MSKKFATLRDVAGGSRGGDSGKESDGEEQSFFVGGSEHSGQQVVGPKSRKNEGADELFKAAKNAGAEVDERGLENASSGSLSFSGGGHRLGDNLGGTERVEAAPTPELSTVPVTMTAYENGFQINNGELRPFDDPSNAAFLNDIARGRIPRELTLQYPGKEIDLKMVRMPGNYEPPKVVVFGGNGSRLGAVVPQVVGNTLPAASKEDVESSAKAAQASLNVDESQPITQIQVRLPDGNRLIARLNQSATVSELRAFIAASHPSLAFSPFELRTSYPNAVIENEASTLHEASLLNAVVLVKLISA